jgi:hypothetical protein
MPEVRDRVRKVIFTKRVKRLLTIPEIVLTGPREVVLSKC